MEMDTELAFWLFLLDQGPEKREWFTSWEYRLWSICPSLLFCLSIQQTIERVSPV